jgi:hypothetical protein
VATTASEPHTIVQSWVPVELAQELKAHAKAEGCSLSSLVRDALEENFARPFHAEAELPATEGSFTRSLSGAGQGEDE